MDRLRKLIQRLSFGFIHTTRFRVAAGLLILYGVLGFVGVPWAIKSFAPQQVTKLIQRPLTLGKVSFNPFLFRLHLKDAALTETDGQPIFRLHRLYVDFELLRTLINRAPTFAEIRLEAPSVNLIQDRDGVFNFAKIAASLPPEDPNQPKPDEDAPPPSVVLKKIVLADGEVLFENQAQEPPIRNRTDHLNLELNNISTLPGRHGLYEVDAALPGDGLLRWEGDVALNPVRSTGTVTIEGLQVATLWRFVEDRVALSEPEGAIAASARYQFSRDRTTTAVQVDDAQFKLYGLKLATAGESAPLAELEEFRIDPTRVDLTQQTVTIPGITLHKGKISLIADKQGQWNWQRVMKTPAPSASATPPSPPAPPTPMEPAPPWKVTLGQLTLSEWGVDYRDERTDVQAQGGIGDIGVSLKAEATAGGAEAPVVQVADLGIRLQHTQLRQAAAPLLDLEDIRLEQASLDLPTQTVNLPRLLIAKGKLGAATDPAGQLNWQRLAPAAPPEQAKAAAEAAKPAPPFAVEPPKPWTVNLDQFGLSDFGVDYTAANAAAPLHAAIGKLSINLSAKATVGGGGDPQVRVDGLGLQLGQTRLDQDKTPLLTLDDIRLEQASVDLAGRAVRLPRVAVSNGQVSAAISPTGELNWLNLQPPAPAKAATPAAPAPRAAEVPPGSPWQVSLDQFSLNKIGLDFASTQTGAPPLQAAIGQLDLGLKANARAGGVEPPVVHVADLGLALSRISLNQDKNALLKLDSVSLDQASLDLPTQTLRIPLFKISKGQVHAAMDAAGQLDWQKLVPPAPAAAAKPAPAPPPGKAAPAKPWQIALDQFRLDQLALGYDDASRAAPLRVSLGDFGLNLKANATVGGPALKAQVEQFGTHLDRVEVRDTAANASLLAWDSLKLEDGHVDLDKQTAAIRRIQLKGGGTLVAREADGAIYPVSLFTAQFAEPGGEPAPAPAAAKPWQLNLGEATVDGFGLGIRDRTPGKPLSYDLDDLAVSVSNLAFPGNTPASLKLRTKIRQGGLITLTGSALPTGAPAKASLKLEGFDLLQAQPFLDDVVALRLQGARLSTDLAVDVRQLQPAPQLRVTGDASLAGLNLVKSTNGAKFLAWNDLKTQGIDFSLGPDQLKIKEVRLIEPDSVVAIHKDKSTNIGDIIKAKKPEPAAAASIPPPAAKPTAVARGKHRRAEPVRAQVRGKAVAAPAEAPTPAKAGAAMPVTIAQIVIDKGKVDFSDDSLILPFATRIHDFGGSIGGFATTPQSRATVQLAGRVDQYGEAKVDGSLSPGDIKQFTDIGVIFRNVTMSSLSPYSATFAGRKIESGKLDLDLQYKIENSQLKSQNKIVLEQFRLGERVESPNASSLPLDLAISLLTDSEGKIQASVPVEGRVDDPKFAYGTLVWDAISTMVTNIVTAPFNALKSVMGNGDLGDPGVVAFDAGSAELPPPEREKLQKLAAALKNRATLKLTVHGGSEPKADTLALKTLAVRRAVAEQLDHAPAPGGQPAAVNVTDLDSQRALEKLASAMGAGDVVAAAYMKDTGRQPQRVGAMSGLLGRPSATPDFYERLLADLVERTPLPASELDALAANRAKAVMTELIDRQRFDRQRIASGKPEPAQENGDRRVAIKLELALQ